MSSNRVVLPEPATPRDAVLLLRRLVELPGHTFWTDDVSITRSQAFSLDALAGHRQVTDAHLLALASGRGGRLATLDRRIRSLVPEGVEAEEVLLVVGEAG